MILPKTSPCASTVNQGFGITTSGYTTQHWRRNKPTKQTQHRDAGGGWHSLPSRRHLSSLRGAGVTGTATVHPAWPRAVPTRVPRGAQHPTGRRRRRCLLILFILRAHPTILCARFWSEVVAWSGGWIDTGQGGGASSSCGPTVHCDHAMGLLHNRL